MAARRGDGTRAVHGAGAPRPGPLVPPIAQTSTFTFASSAELHRYLEGDEELHLYTRYGNPTLRELEQRLAALEGAEDALVLASGMAAATTGLLSLLAPGDEVLCSSSVYGGTARLVRELLPRFGFASRFVPFEELAEVGRHAGPRSRALVFESPTNPTLRVVDVARVCAEARRAGLAVFFDNTFASPLVQSPLALGADLVMYSLTKSLAGHSDLIGGALCGSRERIAAARDLMKVMGGCLDPHAAFLVLRGLRTLHLRVARQGENALAVARFLASHPKVAAVAYPGLTSHPGHALAAAQMRGFGGVLAFVPRGGLPAAERAYDAFALVARAASLGGVETLASLPVHTSHHGWSPEQLAAAGIDPATIRLALGVEDADDLVADLGQALERA